MATFCHGGFGIGAERSATTGGDLRRLRSSGYGIFSMLTRRGILLCETSLLYCPRLIQCAGYDSFGVRLWDLFMNGANRSIGTARMVVVLCSLEISFIVCKDAQLQGNRLRGNHRCRLHEFFRGLKLSSEFMIFARRSRSDSAWPAIARFMLSGKTISLTSTAGRARERGLTKRSVLRIL
jgi:hypothetical protein